MTFSITESAGISHGYLLPSQVVKTQPEFSMGGKGHTDIKLPCSFLEFPLALLDII
jgi:hypothetical protein